MKKYKEKTKLMDRSYSQKQGVVWTNFGRDGRWKITIEKDHDYNIQARL